MIHRKCVDPSVPEQPNDSPATQVNVHRIATNITPNTRNILNGIHRLQKASKNAERVFILRRHRDKMESNIYCINVYVEIIYWYIYISLFISL